MGSVSDVQISPPRNAIDSENGDAFSPTVSNGEAIPGTDQLLTGCHVSFYWCAGCTCRVSRSTAPKFITTLSRVPPRGDLQGRNKIWAHNALTLLDDRPKNDLTRDNDLVACLYSQGPGEIPGGYSGRRSARQLAFERRAKYRTIQSTRPHIRYRFRPFHVVGLGNSPGKHWTIQVIPESRFRW